MIIKYKIINFLKIKISKMIIYNRCDKSQYISIPKPRAKAKPNPPLPSRVSLSLELSALRSISFTKPNRFLYLFLDHFFSTTSYFVLFDEKMSTGELLSIEPLELKFPCKSPMHGFLHSLLHLSLFLLLSFMYFVFGLVELKKQISCSLQLSNYLPGCAFCDKTS